MHAHVARSGLIMALLAGLALLAAGLSSAQDTLAPNVALLKQLADAGDADAQYGLGTYYLRRQASDSDLLRARDLLSEAARQQHVHAMHRLGVLLNQFDATRDQGLALRWVRAAAEQGLAEAQATLGLYYFDGVGLEQRDCLAAADWLTRAHELGHDEAESNLVWVLATCPDDAGRDGSRALRIAFDQIYRRGMKSANQMDNLAAAYAAAGDFISAEVAQAEAIELADSPEVRWIFRQHLQSYQRREVWRDRSGLPD